MTMGIPNLMMLLIITMIVMMIVMMLTMIIMMRGMFTDDDDDDGELSYDDIHADGHDNDNDYAVFDPYNDY